MAGQERELEERQQKPLVLELSQLRTLEDGFGDILRRLEDKQNYIPVR